MIEVGILGFNDYMNLCIVVGELCYGGDVFVVIMRCLFDDWV